MAESGVETSFPRYSEGRYASVGVIAGLPVCSCLGVESGGDAYAGNPAETKNSASVEGAKAGYSIHSGDVIAGECINTGVGIAIRNHDGAGKYCIDTGVDVPTGLDITSAVLACAGVWVTIGLGLATMVDAFDDVSVSGCVW